MPRMACCRPRADVRDREVVLERRRPHVVPQSAVYVIYEMAAKPAQIGIESRKTEVHFSAYSTRQEVYGFCPERRP